MTAAIETAIHEAGHVITAAALGLRVTGVDVIPTPSRLGLARYIRGKDAVKEMAATLGGPVAERRFLSASSFTPGSRGDFASIESDLKRWYGQQGLAYTGPGDSLDYADAIVLARETVNSNWPAIRHLAAWLITHDVASGALVHEIVSQFQSKRGKHARN